jgi:hypothetical protein
VKEAGGTRDEQGSLAEENLDSFVAWYTVTPLGEERSIELKLYDAAAGWIIPVILLLCNIIPARGARTS